MKIKHVLFVLILLLVMIMILKYKISSLDIAEDQVSENSNYKYEQPTIRTQEKIVKSSVSSAKSLSDDEIVLELKDLQNRIYENNIVERLNKNIISHEERESVAHMFERMTELGVEKAERSFSDLHQEFDETLLQTRARMKMAQDLLSVK